MNQGVGKVAVVRIVESELDLGSDIDLSWAVWKHIDKGRIHLVLDLEGVQWIGSEGIGQMVASLKRARSKGGDLKLLRPSGQVSKILTMVGLDQVFEIFQDESEAVASFHPDPAPEAPG